MYIQVNNQAKLSKKYVRFAKWRIYKISEKFKHLLYAEMHITREGASFESTLKLGVPGHDIILKHKNDNIKQLLKKSLDDGARYIRKYKDKQLAY